MNNPASNPLVSVIMPCYNSAALIRPAVESILKQTYRNMEIILIDDGSSDSTPEILQEYARQDSRIRFFRNETNRKLIYTLNRAVSMATSEFLMRMDADDISDRDRIEKQLQFMLRHPDADACSAGHRFIDMQGKVVGHHVPKTTLPKALRFQSFFSTPMIHPVTFGKTEVFKNNPYDPDYIHSEDYELFSRLLQNGYQLYNMTEEIYSFRINPGSVSNKYERVQTETHTRISRRNLLNYFQKNFEFFLHKVMIYRIAFHPDISMVKNALKELDLLRQEFTEREKCTAEELDEIEMFLVEHKIDILIQSFKAATFKTKLELLAVFYRMRRLFMTEKGKRYMKSKFRRISSLSMF